MSEPYVPKFIPYTAKELVEAGWVSRVRGAILKDGNAIRISPFCTIQAQVINSPDDWRNILLPNGGTRLVDFKECVIVAAMLEGVTPIPEPPAPAQ